MSSVTSPGKVLKVVKLLSKVDLCWESCGSCCLLSTSMVHSLKLKLNGKIENRTEKGNALFSEYPTGVPHPSISSSGITFSRNIHPKQPGCRFNMQSLPTLPSSPVEWLWLSLTGFFCKGALTVKQFYRADPQIPTSRKVPLLLWNLYFLRVNCKRRHLSQYCQ